MPPSALWWNGSKVRADTDEITMVNLHELLLVVRGLIDKKGDHACTSVVVSNIGDHSSITRNGSRDPLVVVVLDGGRRQILDRRLLTRRRIHFETPYSICFPTRYAGRQKWCFAYAHRTM